VNLSWISPFGLVTADRVCQSRPCRRRPVGKVHDDGGLLLFYRIFFTLKETFDEEGELFHVLHGPFTIHVHARVSLFVLSVLVCSEKLGKV
jgi:hypothetical protein